MKPFSLSTLLALSLAFSAPAAFSGDAEIQMPSPKLESVLGKDVKTLRDGDSGRVIDLLVDGNGHVRAAVVEFGGFLGIGTRKIAVDWSAFHLSGQSITVDVTRDQLRGAPEYRANEQPYVVEVRKD